MRSDSILMAQQWEEKPYCSEVVTAKRELQPHAGKHLNLHVALALPPWRSPDTQKTITNTKERSLF